MFTLKSLWSIWCDNAEGPAQAVLCNQDILCLLMFFVTIVCSDWRSVSTFFHSLNLFNNLFQLYLCGIDGTSTIDLLRKSLQHSHESGPVNSVQSVGVVGVRVVGGCQPADLSEGGNIQGNYTWYHIWNRFNHVAWRDFQLAHLSSAAKSCRFGVAAMWRVERAYGDPNRSGKRRLRPMVMSSAAERN